MAWDPTDQTFELTKGRILGRAHEQAVVSFESDWRQAQEKLAARGMRGGQEIQRMTELSVVAVQRFAEKAWSELIALVMDATGNPPPPAALEWLRATLTEYVDGIGRGFAQRLIEEGKRHHISAHDLSEAPRSAAENAKRDMEIELDKLELRSRLTHPPQEPAPTTGANYDVFISHASEDKTDVAIPLTEELTKRGFRVWLDRNEIRMGDRLMGRIDAGLRESRYGVVILSHAFFSKQWAKWELHALAAMEATLDQKKILPVWHGVSADDVAKYSPLLAAALGVPSSAGISAIADQIQKVLTGT